MGRLSLSIVRRLAVWVVVLAGVAPLGVAVVPRIRLVEDAAAIASAPLAVRDLDPPASSAGSVPAVPTPSACLTVHVVRQGDTLEQLARRFHTTARAIQTANRLRSTVIFVGQKLVIPVSPVTCPPTPLPTCVPTCPSGCAPVCPTPIPLVCVPRCPAPRVHVVQRGEDLFRIALRFDVSVAVLMQLNGLQTTTVKAGQVLIIPDP